MLSLSLTWASLAVLALAAPQKCTPTPASFHLVAVGGGTSYPLAAVFPAPFNDAGTKLQLYASTATPYNVSQTNVFKYESANKALTTMSKPRANPNGDAVLFATPAETAGQPVVFAQGDSTSNFVAGCSTPSSPAFFYAGNTNSFSLCNGDSTDQQLQRKTIYLNPKTGDNSCVPVTLTAVAA